MCFSFRMCGSFGFLVQVFPVLQEMPSYLQRPADLPALPLSGQIAILEPQHLRLLILSTSCLTAQKKFSRSLHRKHSAFWRYACFHRLPYMYVVAVLVHLLAVQA